MRVVARAQLGPLVWRALGFTLLVCATALLLLDDAFAGESASTKIAALPTGGQLPATASAQPTPAWVEFCARVPTECKIDLSEPATIKLTRETWNNIQAVNKRVNASISAVSDQERSSGASAPVEARGR